MWGITFLENTDMMVLGSIVAVVILAFLLVVLIFTVKFKSQQEQTRVLQERLDEKKKKVILLEESMAEVRTVNTSQLQELNQQSGIREKLQTEIKLLSSQLDVSNEKIEALNMQILSLEKEKSTLDANVQNSQANLLKLEEALEHATRRNEFWVEQMTEVRTKYEALKLKVR